MRAAAVMVDDDMLKEERRKYRSKEVVYVEVLKGDRQSYALVKVGEREM
jgi:hypothetical protein